MTNSQFKYPVSQPSITALEKSYVNSALEEQMISHAGRFVEKFERGFADRHGCAYGVSCNSGTNAVYLALKALGVGPGDTVIVPEFTMIATAYAVSYTGAQPIFVDCGDDLLIDVEKIEEAIRPSTKAIVPVHIYGRLCNMSVIMALASKWNLKVVEDSAEVIGHIIRGHVSAHSFFANKIVTTGEGGMCITDDGKLAKEIHHLANMAFDPGHTFLHTKIAHNFRMTNLQAAFGCAQLERLDEILEKRRLIEHWYEKYLPKKYRSPSRHSLWYYDILCSSEKERDELRRKLLDKGIETRVFFKPMSMQKPYRTYSYTYLRAYDFSLRGLYLPTYTDLTEDDVKAICKAL